MDGIYHGRLACDGNGNLLADEGEHAGMPVAYHEGSYVFVQAGEQSHNDRHHTGSFLSFGSTVDESMTDDPSLVNATRETQPHHWEVQPDDAHYDPDAPNLTRPRLLADAQAAVTSSHTEAYTS